MTLGFLKLGARLRNKILLGVALVALVPFVVSGLFALYIINQSHNNDILAIETNLLNQKAIEVDKYITDSIDQMEIILPFSAPSLVRYLRPEEDFKDKTLVRTLNNGQRIVFAINPPGQLDDILNNALLTNKAFDELYFIDGQTGLEIAYKLRNMTDDNTINNFVDFSHLPQFVETKNGKKDYIGNINFTLRGPVITVAAPVKNNDGQTIGVLAGQLNLSGLKKVLGQTTIGNSGYVYLVDDKGDLIYSSDVRRTQSSFVDLGGTPLVSQFLGGGKNTNQTRYKSFWGEDVVAVSAPLNINSSLRWLLVAEWPASDANRVIDTLRNQFIFFLAAVMVLTLLLSVVLANKIAAPINILQIGTTRIASGKFDEPVEIHTHDEIEDLGTAFNKMIAGLKQLQELKDEFVFIAAHELRTPVAAIKGYLSMIMGGEVGKVDEDAKSFISKVVNANQRLIQLVNDLLQVARSEAGRLTIQTAAIDIVEPIKSVLDELKPLAAEKDIKIIYEPKNLPKVMADSVRLKEVMVNLVGNAIKYTIGSGTVTISHEIKDNALITHVDDTGIGMSAEAQKRLFEKFYRVQTEKTKEITGTGLGLFIVKQIIEKMNGKIWVESEEGRGSTFSFSLPITP